MRSLTNSVRAKAWKARRVARGAFETLRSFHKVMSYIDAIDVRTLAIKSERSEYIYRIEELEAEIENLKSIIDNKIEDAVDAIDVTRQIEDYLVDELDLSDHIDFEDLSEKTLIMLAERISQSV